MPVLAGSEREVVLGGLGERRERGLWHAAVFWSQDKK